MEPSPRPEWARPQHSLDPLREPFVVELSDFSKAERRAVTLMAVLERPDELTAPPHNMAGRSRSRNVNYERILPMRLPRT